VCQRAKSPRECSLKERSGGPGKGMKLNCQPCHEGGLTCGWGERIPLCFYELKLAILAGRSRSGPAAADRSPSMNPDAACEQSPSNHPEKRDLEELCAVTKAALTDINLRIKAEKDKEMFWLIRGMEGMLGGRR
jgi:hypothetical protein